MRQERQKRGIGAQWRSRDAGNGGDGRGKPASVRQADAGGGDGFVV